LHKAIPDRQSSERKHEMTSTSADIQPILKKYPNAKRDALITILQEVQDAQGYVSESAVVAIGRHLQLPASKVYGVATFYNQFRFHPTGRYHVQVCRGTACHVKGSLSVLETVKKELKVEPGQTTRDRLFSLEVVACLGACGLSPVVCVNGEFHARMTPARVRKLIEDCRKVARAEVQ
jgi:NADH-quinone oxidoreductase E subunit